MPARAKPVNLRSALRFKSWSCISSLRSSSASKFHSLRSIVEFLFKSALSNSVILSPRVLYCNVPIYCYYNNFFVFVIYNVFFAFLYHYHLPCAFPINQTNPPASAKPTEIINVIRMPFIRLSLNSCLA